MTWFSRGERMIDMTLPRAKNHLLMIPCTLWAVGTIFFFLHIADPITSAANLPFESSLSKTKTVSRGFPRAETNGISEWKNVSVPPAGCYYSVKIKVFERRLWKSSERRKHFKVVDCKTDARYVRCQVPGLIDRFPWLVIELRAFPRNILSIFFDKNTIISYPTLKV